MLSGAQVEYIAYYDPEAGEFYHDLCLDKLYGQEFADAVVEYETNGDKDSWDSPSVRDIFALKMNLERVIRYSIQEQENYAYESDMDYFLTEAVEDLPEPLKEYLLQELDQIFDAGVSSRDKFEELIGEWIIESPDYGVVRCGHCNEPID